MEYYTMTHSTGKEIGRVYPQLHCLTQYHAHRLSSWAFPTYEPKLDFELYKGAKLTEVLSTSAISANGFVVSQRTRQILDRFHIMVHRYYDVSVSIPQTGERVFYHWLHLCQPGLVHQLDYERSTFYKTEWTFRDGPIKIRSFEHYRSMKSKDKEAKFGVELENIHMGQDFDRSLDLFVLLPFVKMVFVSRRLKSALEENHITGLQFEPSPQVNC